jgi:hypothetical protein
MENKDIISLCVRDTVYRDKSGPKSLRLRAGQSRVGGSRIGANARAKGASFQFICASAARKWYKSAHKLAGNLQKCVCFERKFQKMTCF